MSNFAREWVDAEAALDEAMGEEWRLIPRGAPLRADGQPAVNARPSLEATDRQPVYFTGRFRMVPKVIHPAGRNKPASDVHPLSGVSPVLALSGAEAQRIRDLSGSDPQRGDLVARLADEAFFRVEMTQPLDLGMVEMTLVATNPPELSRTLAEPVYD
ncbi:hypothetical protein GJ654_18780 [Rhodoblastus acidophilus]|uniref:Uncharacterized protein n=1 Tax=Rhodoblastus acidophilus TaxID=1074 RepID=A0A6N8DRE7_RHOAC|nr:hypothetical protein [Rhodoblastus acidophilus]MCW2276374.1 hypothetical protein [Rhodoblastus acidophilus]MTV33029.1 hypothetical protein [Rhodoblastus acidophilus]